MVVSFQMFCALIVHKVVLMFWFSASRQKVQEFLFHLSCFANVYRVRSKTEGGPCRKDFKI